VTRKKKAPKKPSPTAPEPTILGTSDERAQAHARAQQCSDAIGAALTKFHCRLVPYVTEPEPVGRDGTKMQIGAAVTIIPDPLP
jgi:hypothetical protein